MSENIISINKKSAYHAEIVGKMNQASKDVIKEAFLSIIGKVIRRARTRCGWSQRALAEEIGVDESVVNKYEHGKVDINASTMAYISVVCGFDMKEYVEQVDAERIPGDKAISINVLFEELVRYATKKDENVEQVQDINEYIPPKPNLEYSHEKGRWEMIEVDRPVITSNADIEPEPKPSAEKIDEETRFFLEYMNTDESAVKRDVLWAAFFAAKEAAMNGKTAKTLVNAALDYAIRDEDKEVRDRLKWYRKICEKSL